MNGLLNWLIEVLEASGAFIFIALLSLLILVVSGEWKRERRRKWK